VCWSKSAKLAAQRRNGLQLEQARYEARLAQRQLTLWIRQPPGGRRTGAAVEREAGRSRNWSRINARPSRSRSGNLTEEERASIAELSQDLPGYLWNAETTTNQEKKAVTAHGDRIRFNWTG